MMQLVAVTRVSPDVLKVVVEDGSRTCETLCTIGTKELSKGEKIRIINFASEEFNRYLMLGEIDVFEVRSAIQAQRHSGE